jgi:hypothetical protein
MVIGIGERAAGGDLMLIVIFLKTLKRSTGRQE